MINRASPVRRLPVPPSSRASRHLLQSNRHISSCSSNNRNISSSNMQDTQAMQACLSSNNPKPSRSTRRRLPLNLRSLRFSTRFLRPAHPTILSSKAFSLTLECSCLHLASSHKWWPAATLHTRHPGSPSNNSREFSTLRLRSSNRLQGPILATSKALFLSSSLLQWAWASLGSRCHRDPVVLEVLTTLTAWERGRPTPLDTRKLQLIDKICG